MRKRASRRTGFYSLEKRWEQGGGAAVGSDVVGWAWLGGASWGKVAG